MPSLGPINTSERHYRHPRMGPLHLQQLLPMDLLGPINVSERCFRRPRMGPLIFLGDPVDVLGWAYCICNSCY